MTEATETGELGPDKPIAEANSVFLYRLLSGGYTTIRVTAFDVRLDRKSEGSTRIPIDDTVRVVIDKQWFWRRLVVHVAAHRTAAIGGLGRRPAAAIEESVTHARNDLAAAREQAERVGPRLVERAEEAIRAFDGTRYFRHSMAAPLLPRIQRVCRDCRSVLVRRQLDDRSQAALAALKEIGATKKRFESSRDDANERFVASQKTRVFRAFKGVTEDEPTDEQAAAIATDEDVTLVLAGAGAGKTAVITAKVAHLVRNQGAKPGEILVLAFNKDAAKQVRDRLASADRRSDVGGAPTLGEVAVRTFHSFGRRVIADTGLAPTISRFAGDDTLLRQTITRWLKGLPEVLLSFIAYHSNEYRSPFDFENSADYYDFVRTCERRTLNGDLVKSLEEVRVANFLSFHGVRFEYEANYKIPTATKAHRQYQPDFYLPDHGLYIEHFALDEEGRAPKHFRNYEEGVVWKRGVHERYGTRLIETYSWQCREGVLFAYLRQALEREGVELRTAPTEKLLQNLRDAVISGFSDLLATFLQHVRGAGLSPEELKRRAASSRKPLRNRAFLAIFERIREAYEGALAGEQALDFNDLIIHTAELIERGRWSSPYRYVLVDEFQDISAGRMKLLKALRGRDTAFFLVGDDWQSIYRFTGSDVSLFRDCGRHLGHVKTCNLSQTFRYGEGILKPTADFIQRNPVQTRRELRSTRTESDEGITLVAATDQKGGIKLALQDIARREGDAWMADVRGRGFGGGSSTNDNDKPSKVLALGRYRKSHGDLPLTVRRNVFSTVHSAKGLEADYAVVLDLRSGSFPSLKQDDPVLELVLPPAKDAVPHGEERRLFYVAATRAKRGTYLVADATQPSPFVNELLMSSPGLRRLGSLTSDGAPPCPRCGGALIPSESGNNLRCTNHPFCRHLAPRCSACGKGYLIGDNGIAACTGAHCGEWAPLCPRCDIGVLILKNGPYSSFLGCTAFTADPPCEYIDPVSGP